jgi:hypothetical protein
MNPQLLNAANLTLNKCGRPQMPAGLSCVQLYKAYLMQFYFGPSPSQTAQTIQKEITAPAKGLVIPEAWGLRAIQSTQPASLLLQVQLPNGRFLFSDPIALSNIAGSGSYRFVFTKEKDFPIGSKLQITVQDVATNAPQSLALLFEGAYKYYLKGAPGTCLDDVGCEPRYLGTPNQNILSPAWMQGYAPAIARGCFDIEEFTYIAVPPNWNGDPGLAYLALAENGTGTMSCQLDTDTDFAMRRMFFNVIPDDGVTAYNILVRARNGSGYALHDDFVLTQYVTNAPHPHDWELAAGEQIFFDLQLVDFEGEGNVTVQCFMSGPKRGRITS